MTRLITANNRPALRSQVTTDYDDAGRKVTATSDLSAFGDNLLKSESLYNSLGQTTDGQSYTTAYTYNLAGGLVDETYPSGRVVRNAYDGDSRLSEVSSRAAAQAAFRTYAGSLAYTAAETVYQVRLGNGTWEATQFNSRLQVTQLSLGTAQNGHDLWKATYEYGELDAGGNLLAAKNSGNVARHASAFNGLAAPYVQTYRYDSLNRLSEATETSDSEQTWKQSFGYDRYGNRTSINQQKLGA